ncbi:hypothetical protein KL907_003116 [Ogataea polymorpha]|nr:hypothetical protein KL907_003116 [Ogataea polymorpha]
MIVDTLHVTTRNGTSSDVANSGMASVAHRIAHTATTARQLPCVRSLSVLTPSKMPPTRIVSAILNAVQPNRNFGTPSRKGSHETSVLYISTWNMPLSSASSPVSTLEPLALCLSFSIPIISFHTVLRSKTMCSRRWLRRNARAASIESCVTPAYTSTSSSR